MSQLPSNYNFVPIAKEGVVYPEWGAQVSHDIPFQDGLCGELEVELSAQSPLFIRGHQQNKGKSLQPFTDVKGKHALPGTSLRGMLRSVVEIASFGKLSPINDQTFGLRDLHARHLYGDFMADVQRREDNQKQEPMTLVNAGWLYRDEDEEGRPKYYISPCHFARMEYAVVQMYAKAFKLQLDPNQKQSAARKYKNWGQYLTADVELPVRTLISSGTVSQRAGLKRISQFGEVKNGGSKRQGRVVFTGQPQNRRPGEKRKKHHDFFFWGSIGGPDQDLEVTPEQFRTFERIHSDGAEQHANEISPNEEWKFWRQQLRSERGQVSHSSDHALKRCVPVFFIVEKDMKNGRPQLRSFGLAMMFRLAYNQSTTDLRARTQPSFKETRRDFAELMFGHVDTSTKDESTDSLDPQTTLRGRVSIGQANAISSTTLSQPVTAVLSAPKATYYPAYVTQGKRPGDHPETQARGRGYMWTAYMKTRTQEPKLRGWKRYLVRNDWVRRPPLPEKATEKVMTTFQPLKEGARFRFKIRVHNLKPEELGALIWAITFGDAPDAHHLLGMGKAFGYGKVKLSIIKQNLIANDDLSSSLLTDQVLTDSLLAFRRYMNEQTNGAWSRSATLKELIACATPYPTGSDPEHMRAPLLNHPRLKNEFAHYKKQGKALELHSKDQAYRKVISSVEERERI